MESSQDCNFSQMRDVSRVSFIGLVFLAHNTVEYKLGLRDGEFERSMMKTKKKQIQGNSVSVLTV